MGERNPPIVIYADILFSSFLAPMLVKYTLNTLHVVFICATVRYLSLKPDMDREVHSHPNSRISAKVQS
jgi:hypothetical protein